MSTKQKKEVKSASLYCAYCKGRLRKLAYIPAERHRFHKRCYSDGMNWEWMKRDLELEKAQGIVRQYPPVILQNIERSIAIRHGLPADALSHPPPQTNCPPAR